MPTGFPQDSSETRRRFGIPEEAKVVVTAGVLAPRKNLEVLIKCLPLVGMKDLFLLVMGDASRTADLSYQEHLRELVRKLDLEKRVRFTGWLDKEEVWRLYRASDLFILPSLKEGMPNALLEALGADLPCLASNIPGIRDILSHEELMFDPLDDGGLSLKLNLFFTDKDYARRVSQLCLEQKKKFCFAWKERVFEMVTTISSRSCPIGFHGHE